MAAKTRPRDGSGKRASIARSRSTRALSMVAGHLRDEGGAETFRLVNERVRLGMLSALAVRSPMSFAQLKETLGVTDGNLSVHARKLEEAEFIACRKSFRDRRPYTEYALTTKGREAFDRYLEHMEALIKVMRETT